jgi:hypothetical protein
MLQLQPVLGAAACLGLVQPPDQANCEMPEHGTLPWQTFAESVPVPPQNCATATFCSPVPLAVPGFSDLLETTIVLTASLPITGAGQHLDLYSAPPFHPPKA